MRVIVRVEVMKELVLVMEIRVVRSFFMVSLTRAFFFRGESIF